jgi:hypothetical protein
MAGGSPDDKRVGDATLQRIDDLASGWNVPRRARRDEDTPPANERSHEAKASGSNATGEKTKGVKKKKPPDQGNTVRQKAARDKTKARGKERGKSSAASKRPAESSLPPFPRALRGSEQPPQAVPAAARPELARPELARAEPARPEPAATDAAATDAAGIEPDATEEDDRAATQVSDRAATRALSPSARIVTEMFDRAATRVVDREDTEASAPASLDNAATLIYRERAETEIDHPELGPSDGTGAVIEARSDRAADATVLEPPGSGAYAVARADAARMAGSTTAVLRLPPTLPRRRGPLGDVLYILGATFGVARANRELGSVVRKLESEKQARGRRLADLARLAVADSELESETIVRAREEIIELEEQRSRRAGAIAAADAEIAGLERERKDEKEHRAREMEALGRELAAMDEKLEPLHRRARATRQRGFRLRESMGELDRRLARSEKKLGRMSKEQRAVAEANLASLLAERQAIADEQPSLAAELDELEPAIASLVASRADARKRIARSDKEERDALARTAEKVAAVRALKVVDERAEAELLAAQEEALGDLGEQLAEERPAELAMPLRSIEQHDMTIATLERRHLELSELVRSVDRWAVARGVLWLLALAVGVAAALVWSYALR